MLNLLIVGCGGFLGAITRYLVYLLLKTQTLYPSQLATILINTSGCFLLGIIMGHLGKATTSSPYLLLAGTVGFLGSFTTFSTFGFETLTLIQKNQLNLALLNIMANVLLGILAVFCGSKLLSL